MTNVYTIESGKVVEVELSTRPYMWFEGREAALKWVAEGRHLVGYNLLDAAGGDMDEYLEYMREGHPFR